MQNQRDFIDIQVAITMAVMGMALLMLFSSFGEQTVTYLASSIESLK